MSKIKQNDNYAFCTLSVRQMLLPIRSLYKEMMSQESY